ncbi:peptide/nickel transport system permease protein [Kribbella amoyensis]|uniref:Peptide/nickel transport system permease protein n=1 Tax=Kribbella amoyensis TaxID=996641 RepID=A0A561C0F3_9ACTN|nr:ABC transporter permease [Kribbella amoyensis]TWD84625.1 peptide/nickel transport system permease protein [Kribbella amoyensis]
MSNTSGSQAHRRLEPLRRFAQSKSAVVGATGLLILIVVAVFAPLIAPFDPNAQSGGSLLGPSGGHLLGTDQLGRDILSRMIHGARASLIAAAGAVVVGAGIGVPLGLLAGYLGRWVDAIAMRFVDLLLAVPGILLALVMIVALGSGRLNLVLAIGIGAVPEFARLTRVATLEIRDRDFVLAARGMGASTPDTLVRTVLPNVLGPIVIQVVVTASMAVVVEAGLAFLGLGTPPPAPSWGGMLQDARSYLYQSPSYGLFPGLCLVATVFCLDRIGRGLRLAVSGAGRQAAANVTTGGAV